jgi:hypothetical protein
VDIGSGNLTKTPVAEKWHAIRASDRSLVAPQQAVLFKVLDRPQKGFSIDPPSPWSHSLAGVVRDRKVHREQYWIRNGNFLVIADKHDSEFSLFRKRLEARFEIFRPSSEISTDHKLLFPPSHRWLDAPVVRSNADTRASMSSKGEVQKPISPIDSQGKRLG